MDIVRLVGAGALDTVSLVSGDSDFLPLLEYCSDHGVRVEVAAFEDSAAMILRQSCDVFINLSLVDDIRAEGGSPSPGDRRLPPPPPRSAGWGREDCATGRAASGH